MKCLEELARWGRGLNVLFEEELAVTYAGRHEIVRQDL